MNKRAKKKTRDVDEADADVSASATRQRHPPKKQPLLLALSVVLFALWFVFLLVTALFG